MQLIKKIGKYKLFLATFLFLCTLVIAFTSLASDVPDSDTFFIIRTGEYIVETKSVPTTNPFVIHDNCDTIIQQWGFDVLVYEIYNAFGYSGIFVLSALLFLGSVLLVEKFLSIYTSEKWIKLLCLSAFVWVFPRWGVVRPTSISFQLLVSTIIIIENYRHKKAQWLIYLLPIISLLLINIHASMWPVMFVLMLPFICPNVIELCLHWKSYLTRWCALWWKVLIVVAVMIAVGFINPNGLRGIGYVFISYGLADSVGIYELLPNYILSIAGAFACIGIISATIYVYKQKFKIDTAYLYMFIGTAILAGMHVRNTWFLFFGVFPLVLLVIEQFKTNNIDLTQQKSKKPQLIVHTAIAFVLILTITIVATTYTFYVQDSNYTPIQAANYLDQFNNKDDIVLYTGFNNGAYMEFSGYKVYIDARPELFSSKITNNEDILTEWLNLRIYPSRIPAFLSKYEFSHMIVEDGGTLQTYLMNCEDYEEIIVGNGYSVYEKVGWVGDSKFVH